MSERRTSPHWGKTITSNKLRYPAWVFSLSDAFEANQSSATVRNSAAPRFGSAYVPTVSAVVTALIWACASALRPKALDRSLPS